MDYYYSVPQEQHKRRTERVAYNWAAIFLFTIITKEKNPKGDLRVDCFSMPLFHSARAANGKNPRVTYGWTILIFVRESHRREEPEE